MIVVNTPGTWAHVYPPLLHAEWHGWTPTDMVFPFFLFIVGVSMSISFARRRGQGASRRDLFAHALRRGVIIFAIGLALNALSVFFFFREYMRIPGVLQRIGLVYVVAAAAFLWLDRRGLIALTAVLLLGYWAVMALVPVPGFGPGRYDKEGNLASYVDRLVLGRHTWREGWDPEGPLSTIPAVATALMGALAGEWLRSEKVRRKTTELAIFGALAAAAGLLWGRAFPINKSLWTSSYALLMAGFAAILLAACIWIVDIKGWNGWTRPFEWLGRNAIAAFVGSSLGVIVLLAIRFRGPTGRLRSLYSIVHGSVFDRFADPRLGSLLFALTYLAIWLVVFAMLYRRRVFLKI